MSIGSILVEGLADFELDCWDNEPRDDTIPLGLSIHRTHTSRRIIDHGHSTRINRPRCSTSGSDTQR